MMRINSISNNNLKAKQSFGEFLSEDARDMARDICYTKGTGNKNTKNPDVYTMSHLDDSKLVQLYTEKSKKNKNKKVLKAKINTKYAKQHKLEYDVERERELYRLEHDLWFRNVGNYNRLYHLGQFAYAFAPHEYYDNSEYDIISKGNYSSSGYDYEPSDYDRAVQYLQDRGMFDR